MIILEGPDGAGKTTLAQAICQQLASTNSLGRFTPYGLLPPWWDYGSHYLTDVKPGAVLDRFVHSELVYGPIFRDSVNSRLTRINQSLVWKECARVGALLVYLRPPVEIMMDRIKSRGDDVVAPEQIAQLQEKFDFELGFPVPVAVPEENEAWGPVTFTAKCGLKCVVPQWDLKVELSAGIIRAMHLNEEDKTAWIREPDSVYDATGCANADECDAVFVGDRNSLTLPQVSRRWIAFANGPISEHLDFLLRTGGMRPAKSLYCSAYPMVGYSMPDRIIKWALEFKIPLVGLGEAAQEYLRSQNVEQYVACKHPVPIRGFDRGGFERSGQRGVEMAKQIDGLRATLRK